MMLWDFPSVERLAASSAFSSMDLCLAGFLCRVAGRDDPALALAAALAGRSMAGGDVCVDLAHLDSEAAAQLAKAGVPVPVIDSWCAALAASPAVGLPGEFKPLILDGARIYLERLHRAETELARNLLERAAREQVIADQARTRADMDRARAALARLFPDPPPGPGPDMQKLAAFTALTRSLCVVTGGPGTGKTFAVARLLALLAAVHGPDMRVGLAAPTGKAAARLTQSLAKALGPALDLVLDQIPPHLAEPRARTIHSLLGARPDGTGFRHHRGNPLALDLLVVDEASMVDLPLMAALVEALPGRARLVLLGDKDQLASVEPGAVMGDICAGPDLQRFSPACVKAYTRLDPGAPPQVLESAPPLLDCIVELTHSFRFGADQGIGAVSRALRAGRGREALELLRGGRGGAQWLELAPGRGAQAALEPHLAAGWEPLCRAADPAQALALLDGFRALTPLRKGFRGVEGLNRLAREALERRGLVAAFGRSFERMPLMILRNDRSLELANGDTGVVFRGSEGALRAFFAQGRDGVRDLSLARLPEHEPVYAMTVHKSQGSEFDRVLLVLSEAAEQVLARELLYTALTRARGQVLVAGSAEVFLGAADRRMERRTGLAERLWGGDGEVL